MKSNDEKNLMILKNGETIYKIEEKYERKNIPIFNGVKIAKLMSLK